MKIIIAAASAAAALSLVPALAQAQTAPTSGVYGTLGYAHLDADDAKLGGLQGRLGYRFNGWLGVEAEGAFGINDDKVNVAGTDVKVELKRQVAAYAVGFAPVGANTDVFARLGYGNAKIKASSGGVSVSDDGNSWNYGVGVQHHFDGVNGVRLDWTRHDFDGGNADVWAVAYTRKF